MDFNDDLIAAEDRLIGRESKDKRHGCGRTELDQQNFSDGQSATGDVTNHPPTQTHIVTRVQQDEVCSARRLHRGYHSPTETLRSRGTRRQRHERHNCEEDRLG